MSILFGLGAALDQTLYQAAVIEAIELRSTNVLIYCKKCNLNQIYIKALRELEQKAKKKREGIRP